MKAVQQIVPGTGEGDERRAEGAPARGSSLEEGRIAAKTPYDPTGAVCGRFHPSDERILEIYMSGGFY